MSYVTEYPFGQLSSTVLDMSPSSFLVTPNLLAAWQTENLDIVQLLLSNSQNTVLSRLL